MSLNGDAAFRRACLACAALAAVLMVGFFVQLSLASGGAWRAFGWRLSAHSARSALPRSG